jgi:hypothetical protein
MVECDAIVDAILAFGIIFVAIFVFTFGNSHDCTLYTRISIGSLLLACAVMSCHGYQSISNIIKSVTVASESGPIRRFDLLFTITIIGYRMDR